MEFNDKTLNKVSIQIDSEVIDQVVPIHYGENVWKRETVLYKNDLAQSLVQCSMVRNNRKK